MENSKVYFTDMRARPGTSLPEKLKKLVLAAGLGELDLEKKLVAIKVHFGEPGNLAYLRPNYAKVIADLVREKGGVPFLTDCNTLYVGRRKNAVEHIEAAYENGYNPFTTGCQVIIGDGLKGTDDIAVPVAGGELVKEAKIGRAIMDADVFISLNHFKGHECTGFGGALKNIGMGCGSRAGKMEQHNTGKPSVSRSRCKGCGMCAKICAQSAISYDENRRASIDHSRCAGCGRCLGICNFDAIYNSNSSANDDLCIKMAEYAKAVLDGRPHFHISLAVDISPYCDCHAENDAPILPDIGMYASFDPVAIDQACADACNAAEPLPNSLLGENLRSENFHNHHDHFTNTTPETNWQVTLAHAQKLGIGSRSYELVTLK